MISGKTIKTATTTLLIFIAALIAWQPVSAQLDSSYKIVRNGDTAIFSFKVFRTPEHVRPAGLELPVYGFNTRQFIRIHGLLTQYVDMEKNYSNWKLIYSQKDSIYSTKDLVYKNIDSVRKEQIQNYQTAYTSLQAVNEQLNNYIKDCEKIARQQFKRNNLTSILFGVLGGLTTGIVLGVIIK